VLPWRCSFCCSHSVAVEACILTYNSVNVRLQRVSY
jgi:hypothetical protein